MRWLNCIANNTRLLCVSLILMSSTVTAKESAVWQHWTKQGEAEFSYLFWDIYSSALFSELPAIDTKQDLSAQNLALVIRYQRDIKGKKLVEATEKQWKKHNYRHSDMEQWLVELRGIYPDVIEGDSLAFVVRSEKGQFYFKSSGAFEWKKIGSTFNRTFTNAFLMIWLGKDTEYPGQRRQLLGEQ